MKKTEQIVNFAEILNTTAQQCDDDSKTLQGRAAAYREIANYIVANKLKITQAVVAEDEETLTVKKPE